MAGNPGFLCARCGAWHDGLPFGYATLAPDAWRDELASDPNSLLAGEQCEIEGQYFFIRANIVVPVVDADEDFQWGVWVSLSEANYTRTVALWTDPRRVEEPPYFGWLATALASYEPTTLNLATNLHTQPVGVRPIVELDPTSDHPLAVEQRTGITLARVQAIAERLLHPNPPATG